MASFWLRDSEICESCERREPSMAARAEVYKQNRLVNAYKQNRLVNAFQAVLIASLQLCLRPIQLEISAACFPVPASSLTMSLYIVPV